LSVDDFTERLFGNFLILTASIGRSDDPDGLGIGAGGRLLEELTSDGAALVLELKRELSNFSVRTQSMRVDGIAKQYVIRAVVMLQNRFSASTPDHHLFLQFVMHAKNSDPLLKDQK
jgi:hypothetical protein